jgi:hypothetical protein
VQLCAISPFEYSSWQACFNIPTPTPTPTLTCTPSPTKTVTPTPTKTVTPTVTPTITTTPRDPFVPTLYTGETGIFEYLVNVGTREPIGIQFTFDNFQVPDRYIWYDIRYKRVLFDTGFRGDPSYNDDLAALGYPPVVGSAVDTLTAWNTTNGYVSPTDPNNTWYVMLCVVAPLENSTWRITTDELIPIPRSAATTITVMPSATMTPERVVFTNTTNLPVNLYGWLFISSTEPTFDPQGCCAFTQTYQFTASNLVLFPNDVVTLFSGTAPNLPPENYGPYQPYNVIWSSSGNIWNDTGDRLRIFDAYGNQKAESSSGTCVPIAPCTPLPSRTPTPTPSITPTRTPTPTPTNTPTITPTITITPTVTPTISLTPTDTVFVPGHYADSQGIFVIPINVGTYEPTTLNATFNTFGVPDRIVVYQGGPGSSSLGPLLYDTGFRGDPVYNSQLIAMGYPPVVGDSVGSFDILNTDIHSTWYITLCVIAPIFDSGWEVNVSLVPPTPTPTCTPSLTPTQTATPTNTPTNTPTVTPTVTSTVTPTVTPTITPTVTPTNTPTVTPTNTPTVTPTITPTGTPPPTPAVSPLPPQPPPPPQPPKSQAVSSMIWRLTT